MEVVSWPLCVTSFTCQCNNVLMLTVILNVSHHLPVSAISSGDGQLSDMSHHLPISFITYNGGQLSHMSHIIYLSVAYQMMVVSYFICLTSFTCQCQNRWWWSAISCVSHHLPVSSITDNGCQLSHMSHIIYLSVP